MPIPASRQKIRDLKRLLSGFETPKKNLNTNPSIWIFEDVHYLMPLAAAEKALDLEIARKAPIQLPGMPNRSFFYREYKGAYGRDYDRLLLVTDMKDQVVAVQFSNAHPASRRRENAWHSWSNSFHEEGTHWHLFNLVEGKTKGASRARIAFRVGRSSRGLVALDSEFWTSDRELSELNLLYLPSPWSTSSSTSSSPSTNPPPASGSFPYD
jgi:hypothetical protein